MKTTKRSFLVPALLAAAACGGGGGSDTSTTPLPAAESEAPPPAETTPPPAEATPPAPTPAPAQLRGYTAGDQGFLVNSYAVVDGGEILLIDAQFIKPEADKVVEMLKGLEGKLTTIFITHPHPDHYFGLETITAAFPDAKVVATQDTVDAITKESQGVLAFYKSKKAFKGAFAPHMPSKIVIPEPLTGDTLKVGNTELKVLTFMGAEAKIAHALHDPKSGALFTGDIAFNKVHMWLKETPPPDWIAALEELKKLAPQRVFPGHGEPGGVEILDADLAYLKDFDAAVKTAKKQKDLVKAVTGKYADWRLPIIVELAAPTYKKK